MGDLTHGLGELSQLVGSYDACGNGTETQCRGLTHRVGKLTNTWGLTHLVELAR